MQTVFFWQNRGFDNENENQEVRNQELGTSVILNPNS